MGFGSFRYSSSVSVPRIGVASFATSSDHCSCWAFHCVAFRLLPVVMVIFLSFCIRQRHLILFVIVPHESGGIEYQPLRPRDRLPHQFTRRLQIRTFFRAVDHRLIVNVHDRLIASIF